MNNYTKQGKNKRMKRGEKYFEVYSKYVSWI